MTFALWECRGCGTTYRLRITRCPRCHGVRMKKTMPKITVHGGVSGVEDGGETLNVQEEKSAEKPGMASRTQPEPRRTAESETSVPRKSAPARKVTGK